MQHVRTVATEAGPHPLALVGVVALVGGVGAWVTQSRERLEILWRKDREHLCRALDALAACLYASRGWQLLIDVTRPVARKKVPLGLKEVLSRQGHPWKSVDTPSFFLRPLTQPVHDYARAGVGGPLSLDTGQTGVDSLWTVATPGALRGGPSLLRALKGGESYVR